MKQRNKTLDLIHTKVHALRMMNYKPSKFELQLNRLICEEYKDECEECKNKLIILNSESEKLGNEGFLGGMFK